MNKYLSSNLKFLSNPRDMIKSTIEFTLGMIPKDLPFNPGYGVEIPTDFVVKDFCDNYKNNLATSLNYLNLGVTVDSVTIDNRNLIVKIKLTEDDIETWSLSI